MVIVITARLGHTTYYWKGGRTLACAILQRVKMSNHYRCGFTILWFLFLLPKGESFYKTNWLTIKYNVSPESSQDKTMTQNMCKIFSLFERTREIFYTYCGPIWLFDEELWKTLLKCSILPKDKAPVSFFLIQYSKYEVMSHSVS